MTKLSPNYTDQETEITYTLSPEGYYLPDLALPENEEHYDIGRFGLMRRHYLKNHRKGLFSTLLMSGKLNAHLHGIEVAALDRMELLTKQMANREGVTSIPCRWALSRLGYQRKKHRTLFTMG